MSLCLTVSTNIGHNFLLAVIYNASLHTVGKQVVTHDSDEKDGLLNWFVKTISLSVIPTENYNEKYKTWSTYGSLS